MKVRTIPKSVAKKFLGFLLLSVVAHSVYPADLLAAITLKDALDQAESYHPVLKASVSREAGARSAIGVREAEFYPHAYFDAIDSTGFPGSTSALGVTGLMGSPFRSGFAYGAVVTQNVWDFGRTLNRVRESKSLAAGQAEQTRVSRYELDDHVIQAYFDCALSRAQADTWSEIARSAHLVATEVGRFVRTGQRSVVDGYLSRTQEQSAVASEAGYAKRAEISERRLGVLIGMPAPSCFSIAQLNSSFGFTQSSLTNPYIEYEKRLTDAAKSRLSASNSDYLPKLVAIGSVGQLTKTNLEPKKDYSVGVGLIFPLFEGFATKSQVEQDEAAVSEQEFRTQAATLYVDETNHRFDENILSAQAQLHELEEEVTLAQKAFETAKKRYFTLQGTLIDVRDSLNDLSRVLTLRNTTMATYLSELSKKQILNGAR